MCRFLAYKGEGVLLADLLTRPSHSLIKQSYCSRLREEPLNGDGFGVGWYNFELDNEPGLFTSLTPAWGNRNLQRLAEKLRSTCFFAHVRAATPGFSVSETNCHPFKYKGLLWMHNGCIGEFLKIKRLLRASLEDEYYHMIQGATDSEHAFALFLNLLPKGWQECTNEQMAHAMEATIRQLDEWAKKVGVASPSTLNFAVTDGNRIVATRYSTSPERLPESLYYIEGEKLEFVGGTPRMKAAMVSRKSFVVSSEPITENGDEWKEVPANSIVTVDTENSVKIIPLGY